METIDEREMQKATKEKQTKAERSNGKTKRIIWVQACFGRV